MRTFAFGDDAQHQAAVSLSAGRFELLAREREGLVFVEVRALTDLREERAEVVGADGAIDVLALAEVRLGGVDPEDRGDFRVEVESQLLPGSVTFKAGAPGRGAQRRQCR